MVMPYEMMIQETKAERKTQRTILSSLVYHLSTGCLHHIASYTIVDESRGMSSRLFPRRVKSADDARFDLGNIYALIDRLAMEKSMFVRGRPMRLTQK